MTTRGFIGSGNIGGTVAELAVSAGHEVVISNSRGPDTEGWTVQPDSAAYGLMYAADPADWSQGPRPADAVAVAAAASRSQR